MCIDDGRWGWDKVRGDGVEMGTVLQARVGMGTRYTGWGGNGDSAEGVGWGWRQTVFPMQLSSMYYSDERASIKTISKVIRSHALDDCELLTESSICRVEPSTTSPYTARLGWLGRPTRAPTKMNTF